MYDVIIVGGGPSGLSAALLLGRCRRRVLVCDAGHPRNAASHAVHAFLTRDGCAPGELLRIAREQLRQYGVDFRHVVVEDACHRDGHFEVALDDGSRLQSRKLLLATGVVDEVPHIDGIADLYGRSVHHCPYCDAWEVRDQPLAAYGPGASAFGLALSLKTWSDDVALCTGGPSRLSPVQREELADHEVRVFEDAIARLDGRDGILERVVFTSGDALPRRALFFNTGQHQRSPLPLKLGCTFTKKGVVRTNRFTQAHLRGLFVVGDASPDVQLVVIAAAEGAKAGWAINQALQAEEREGRRRAP